MSAALIYDKKYSTMHCSIVTRAFRIGLVATIPIAMWLSTWLLPPPSGPSVCDPAPIDLPHIDTPDMPGPSPGRLVMAQTATPTVAPLCFNPSPKHNTR